MSYILEALKKSQAERQLGSAPSIHTLPIPTATASQGAADRTPWLLAGAGVVLALAVGVMWWRQTPAPAPVQAQAAAPVVVAAATPQPATIVVPPSPVPDPVPAPVAVPPAPKAAPAPVRPAHVSPAYVPPIPPAVKPAPPVAAPSPEPVAAAPEENLPMQAQLPADVQGQLPRVAFGGYMYSRNPADRLLLIDKVLRREGEEVAPGLILEQLQPRSAVMNYRGTRYRVPY